MKNLTKIENLILSTKNKMEKTTEMDAICHP